MDGSEETDILIVFLDLCLLFGNTSKSCDLICEFKFGIRFDLLQVIGCSFIFLKLKGVVEEEIVDTTFILKRLNQKYTEQFFLKFF